MVDATQRRAAPRHHDYIGLAIITVLLFGWWLRTVNLFPQSEFIDWIWYPTGATAKNTFEAITTFGGDGFSRHISILWASSTGRVCGTNFACLNTLVFVPVAGAAYALYGLARMIRLSAVAATAIVVTLLISQPMFDVMTWQATLHDRLATFAVPVLLMLTLVVIRREGFTRLSGALWALGLGVACWLSMNTKEPAWIMVPLLAAAPVLFARNRRHALTLAALFAPALILMSTQILRSINGQNNDPVVSSHVGSGSIQVNVPLLTTFTMPGGLYLAELIGIFVVAALVTTCFMRDRDDGVARESLAITTWLAIGVLASWAIPARTAFPSAFYMLLPLALVALMVASATRGLLLTVPLRAIRNGVLAGVTLLFCWVVGVSAFDRWDPYGQLIREDKNFRASFDEIDAIHRAHPNGDFQFNFQSHYGVRLVTVSRADTFWRIAGDTINWKDKITPLGKVDSTCGSGGTTILLYDADGRFVKACPRQAPG